MFRILLSLSCLIAQLPALSEFWAAYGAGPAPATSRCCCCPSAATCRCGCESTDSLPPADQPPDRQVCPCDDQPVPVPTSTGWSSLSPVVTRATECAAIATPADLLPADRVVPAVDGPPPDLLRVRLFVLLI